MVSSKDILDILKTIPWFLDLKPSHLKKLAGISSIVDLNTGDLLFKEGDREDFVYLILEGQMDLCMRVPNHGKKCIFTAEPLDVVGWSSLTPVVRQRTTCAKANRSTRLLALDGEALRQLCDEDHDLGYIIMRRIANVVASRFLTMRLQLLEVIVQRDASRTPTTLE